MSAVKEAFVAFSLLSALGGLLGCGKPDADPYAWVPPENPPPEQPNCPETAELASIRLVDGSYADVRIIQFGEARLYVPTPWLVGQLVDEAKSKYLREGQDVRSEGLVSGHFGRFSPDLYRDECPGIVHIANLEGVRSQFGSKMNTTQFGLSAADSRKGAPRDPRFGGERIDGVELQATIMTDGGIMGTPWSQDAIWARPHPSFFANVYDPMGNIPPAERQRLKRELQRLGEWLLTTPKNRNENETFFGDVRP